MRTVSANPKSISFETPAILVQSEFLAAPANGVDEYTDAEQRALKMLVYAGGVKSYQFRAYQNGRRVKKTIGHFPELNPGTVRERVKQMLGEDVREQVENKPRQGAKLVLLLEDYLRENRHRLKDSTAKDMRKGFRLGYPKWLNKPATDITTAMIRKRYNDRIDESPTGSPVRANLELRYLAAVLQDAHDTDPKLYPNNPAKSFKKRKKNKQREGRLKPQGMQEFAVYLAGKRLRTRNFLYWCLYTGNRVGEVMSIRRDDIDLQTGIYLLRDIKTSDRDGDVVEMPLSRQTKAVVESQLQDDVDSEYLFPCIDGSEQTALPSSYLRNSPYSFHDLRKLFRSVADGLDISRIIAMRLVNHSSAEDVDSGLIIFTDKPSHHQLIEWRCCG